MLEACRRKQEAGKIAMVVDDDRGVRLLITALLENRGYEVIDAEDGAKAVNKYFESHPDIVFMDLDMPLMNGLEATKIIKEDKESQNVPIIFITGHGTDEELAQCIDAGGDDLLVKPFSSVLFNSRLDAIERSLEAKRLLQYQHDMLLREEILAERIFSDVVMGSNLEIEGLNCTLRPAVTFSGDLLLTAQSPADEIFILLGDFTGHGISAALGAMPTSDIFRAMVGKGFGPEKILSEINKKLHAILPADMFLAACLVRVSKDTQTLTVWNGGLPDALIVNVESGEIISSIASTHLALGITENADIDGMEYIVTDDEYEVVIYTDGLIEAQNYEGEFFGQNRLYEVINNVSLNENVFSAIQKTLDDFVGEVGQTDDISLITISGLIKHSKEKDNTYSDKKINHKAIDDSLYKQEWKLVLELHEDALNEVDPVPIIIGYLMDLYDIQSRRHDLFVVLSELFNNAYDHGVLGLESSLKTSVDGFVKYMECREQRANELDDGFVQVQIEKMNHANGNNNLHITLIDSGNGFEYDRFYEGIEKDDLKFCGRGLKLVNSLCETLEFSGKGNVVKAILNL